MVYFFQSRDGHLIYVGKDKVENEDLIKFGWPEDIWFHADDHSSAHVYLRLLDGESFENIPIEVLEDCCQLTKQGSISGSKLDKINIVYTPWSNLKKEQSMQVGAVGYHKQNMKKIIKDVEKNNQILKVLVKTKKEEYPDLRELKELHIKEIQKEKLNLYKKNLKDEQLQQQQIKEEQDLKNYKSFFQVDNYKSNKEQDDDDDFM